MPNLSNNGLQNLFIDGKAVKKASLGGKVFFEKHNYDLSLVSDKDILSYYDEDSATLTARLTDYGEPVEGEEVIFSCDDELETISLYTNETHSFTSNYFEIDASNMESTTTVTFINNDETSPFIITRPINDLSIVIQTNTGERKSYYLGNDLITIKGNQIFFTDRNNNNVTEKANINISGIKLSGFSGTESTSNISISKKLFCETGTTNSNGECSVVYDSKGTGDLNIKCECPERSLVTEIYVETIDTSNPYSVGSDGYTAPVRFVGEIKRNGYWGGVRIYGTDAAHNYIFLSQNSYNSHESEKIWYVLGSSWVSFEAIIKDGTVQLYINDNLIQSVNTDTTGTVYLWGGSNANPVSLRNLKVTNLIIS